jgi:proteic killer suppression protein
MVLKRFKDEITENIFKGIPKKGMPGKVIKIAKEKIFNVIIASNLKHLKTPPSNHLEELKGDRKGQYSIRVNEKYRICFNWVDGKAFNIEFVDYH